MRGNDVTIRNQVSLSQNHRFCVQIQKAMECANVALTMP